MATATSIVVDPSSTRLLLHTPLLIAEDQQDIVPNTLDYKNRPAIRSNYGQWKSASFIIWVEMAERLAYYGISGNLINFLTGKLRQSTATAAANVNAWSGVASLSPVLGAVIADSFLGRFYTILVSSIIYILGLGLLTLSAMLPSLSCINEGTMNNGTFGCSSHLQTMMFFIALYMVAIGQGGHKPCVQAFGADQFDGENPAESKAKSSFFNWWYFGLCMGSLLGIGVLSYVQENLNWGLGFGIPCIIMVIALLIFLLGTATYRYIIISENESPFLRIGRVFVKAAQNWNVKLPVIGNKEDAHGTQTRDGTHQFRFLDKASFDGCSNSEVGEAKGVLRLFPIWAATLVYGIIYSQTSTFFTKQGITLERSIGSTFVIPAAALQCFIGICIVIFIPIYDRVLVPIARYLTGKHAGISMLQRIGTGLIISILSMAVAAVTEKKRLQTAAHFGLIDLPDVTIPMKIWWLLPQYMLFAISEAFTMVGLQEFFYDQVPKELRSVGLSMYLSIFGWGGLLSSFLVSMINKVSSKCGRESWFSDNLNRAHLDYFYWLLSGLSVIGSILFIYFAKSYIYNNNNNNKASC
ncbi:protein NRT1/ PTR FAMILY 5.10-like [Amaranthus tricolor]|uniref:protein NRT1/ PTR FAMILY 5.10-like n=1 Tax=Amaranthus tricolor TaxID=29722 RepID=UPI002587CF3B|nr:protein NRT1/ PTR FAMILY 5.10-like [Amaranthus tricolor]